MLALMIEIAGYILAAALIGFLIGYVIWGWDRPERIAAARAEGARAARTSVDGEAGLQARLEASERRSELLEAEVDRLTERLARLGMDPGTDPAGRGGNAAAIVAGAAAAGMPGALSGDEAALRTIAGEAAPAADQDPVAAAGQEDWTPGGAGQADHAVEVDDGIGVPVEAGQEWTTAELIDTSPDWREERWADGEVEPGLVGEAERVPVHAAMSEVGGAEDTPDPAAEGHPDLAAGLDEELATRRAEDDGASEDARSAAETGAEDAADDAAASAGIARAADDGTRLRAPAADQRREAVASDRRASEAHATPARRRGGAFADGGASLRQVAASGAAAPDINLRRQIMATGKTAAGSSGAGTTAMARATGFSLRWRRSAQPAEEPVAERPPPPDETPETEDALPRPAAFTLRRQKDGEEGAPVADGPVPSDPALREEAPDEPSGLSLRLRKGGADDAPATGDAEMPAHADDADEDTLPRPATGTLRWQHGDTDEALVADGPVPSESLPEATEAASGPDEKDLSGAGEQAPVMEGPAPAEAKSDETETPSEPDETGVDSADDKAIVAERPAAAEIPPNAVGAVPGRDEEKLSEGHEPEADRPAGPGETAAPRGQAEPDGPGAAAPPADDAAPGAVAEAPQPAGGSGRGKKERRQKSSGRAARKSKKSMLAQSGGEGSAGAEVPAADGQAKATGEPDVGTSDARDAQEPDPDAAARTEDPPSSASPARMETDERTGSGVLEAGSPADRGSGELAGGEQSPGEGPSEGSRDASPGGEIAAAATEDARDEADSAPAPGDGDGARAGGGSGTYAPGFLMDSRPAEVDDLTRIRGIGRVMARVLNGKGVWQYRQIAGLSPEDVEWLTNAIGGPAGRIRRDDWVGQARALQGGQGDSSA